MFTVPKGLDPAGVCGGPYSSPIGSSAEDQSQEHGRGDSTRPPSVLFTVEPSTCSVCVRRVVLGGVYGMRRALCGRSRVAMFGKTSGELVLAFWVRVCVSRVGVFALANTLESGTVLGWGGDEPPLVPK